MAKIKYYMDEHIPPAVTKGLRRREVDVLTAQEAGMLDTDDDKHLALAVEQGRVIFSQDQDFLKMHNDQKEHCGIVYAPQQTAIGVLVRGLMLIFEVLTAEEMKNHIEYL